MLCAACTIAIPGGGRVGNCLPSFQNLGKNQNFRAMTRKYLGKTRNFREATMINCKTLLPNLGEDLFFLESTFDFGTKIEKYETDSKRRPFFLRAPRF